MDSILYDAKLALRSLSKQPLFFVVVLLTFALGLGASTALFSVVYGVVFRPLGFRDEGRLLAVSAVNPREGLSLPGHFLPDFWFWRENVEAFDEMAFYGWRSMTLQEPDQVERLESVVVSANLFHLLGLEPALGRVFEPDDEVAGDGQVVLISDGLWQRIWGRDPRIVGRGVELNGEVVTIIGVMPPGTNLPTAEAELWRTVGYIESYETSAYGREERDFWVVGRLAVDATEARARAEMASLAETLAETYPATNDGWTVDVRPLRDQIVGGARTPLYIAFASVGLVFLIACANIANLVMVRATTREREAAVRAALGAGRGRMFQQRIVESSLLTFLGGGAAVLVALGLTTLVLANEPGILPRVDAIRFGAPVFLFALLASLVCGVVFGAVSALHRAAGSSLPGALRQSGGELGSSGRQNRTRMLLVGGELALALALLSGSGLLVKALGDLSRVDPGFQPRDLYASHLILSEDPYRRDLESRRVFFERLVLEVRGIPGVSAAAVTTTPPVPGAGIQIEVPYRGADGPLASEPGAPRAAFRVTGPGYFATVGTPLTRGRDFTERDDEDAPGVAIINETLARRAFGDDDALGRPLDIVVFGDRLRVEVIGISADTRFAGLDLPPEPELFVPHPQIPFLGMGLVARSALGPAVYAESVRRAVRTLDPRLAVMYVEPLEEALSDTLAMERFYSMLLIVFTTVALVLCATGTYGVFAFWVSRRRRELGLRVALGATPGDVIQGVLGRALAVTALGIAAGTVAALVLGRNLESTFRGVDGADPIVLALAASALTLMALAACIVPARDAARVEPSVALRSD